MHGMETKEGEARYDRRTHELGQCLVRSRDERVVAEYDAIESGKVVELHPAILEHAEVDLNEASRLPHAASRLELDKCTGRWGKKEKKKDDK